VHDCVAQHSHSTHTALRRPNSEQSAYFSVCILASTLEAPLLDWKLAPPLNSIALLVELAESIAAPCIDGHDSG
jgi:hypothetical protein